MGSANVSRVEEPLGFDERAVDSDRSKQVVVHVVGMQAQQHVRHERVVVTRAAIVFRERSRSRVVPQARPLIVALSLGDLISM